MEDLLNNYDAVNRFQQRGKRFCDVERLLTKVYTYSVRSVNDNSDVYVASSWNLKLTLFKKLLSHLTQLVHLIPEIFEVCKGDFKSKRLKNLCTLRPVSLEEDDEDDSDSDSTHTSSTPDKQEEAQKVDTEMPKEGGELIVTNNNYGFSPTKEKEKPPSPKKPKKKKKTPKQIETKVVEPVEEEVERSADHDYALLEKADGLFDNFLPLLQPFLESIVWCPSQGHFQLPRPKHGLDPKIDRICERIDSIREKLKVFLNDIRKELASNAVTFQHTRRFKY